MSCVKCLLCVAISDQEVTLELQKSLETSATHLLNDFKRRHHSSLGAEAFEYVITL